MAVFVYDGFDHYGAQADMQARNGRLAWSDVPAGSITFTTGRGGYGYAASLNSGFGFILGAGCSFNQNFTQGFPSIATFANAAPGSSVSTVDYMLMDYSSNAIQLCFRTILNSGIVQVWTGDPDSNNGTGGTLLGASPPNAFSPFIWNKIETGAVIGSSSAGSFDIHVNGTSVFSMTGVTTQATGNAFFNGFKVRITGVDALLLDDFNMNDATTGAGTYPCNSFLGDVATRTVFTTGNSAVTWTPLANANWQEVGETRFDGDTSYNSSNTVGNSDFFTFGSLPTTVSVVFAVQVTGGYRKLDASAQTILQSIKSGGTTSAGTAYVMSLSYSYVTDLFVLDPHTGATWAPTAVNAVIAGYTLNS